MPRIDPNDYVNFTNEQLLSEILEVYTDYLDIGTQLKEYKADIREHGISERSQEWFKKASSAKLFKHRDLVTFRAIAHNRGMPEILPDFARSLETHAIQIKQNINKQTKEVEAATKRNERRIEAMRIQETRTAAARFREAAKQILSPDQYNQIWALANKTKGS